MSRPGASADCPAPIIAGSGVSICEPSINGSPVSVTYSVARCGTTNHSLNDTVLGLAIRSATKVSPKLIAAAQNLNWAVS